MRYLLFLLIPLLAPGPTEGKRGLFRVQQRTEEDLLKLVEDLDSKKCDVVKVSPQVSTLDFICDSEVLQGEDYKDVRTLIEDLDKRIEEEKRDIQHQRRRQRRSTNSLPDFKNFLSFEEIESFLKYIAEKYPRFVKLEEKGRTHEDRPLYFLRIGQISDRIEKKAIFLDGGIHAREWGSVSSVAYIISKLVLLFSDPKMMKNDVRSQVNWYIMPVVNPDGYEYTRSNERLWRKNRAPPPKGSECYGVDLNRNWNVSGYGVGASSDPCSDIYKGASPDSEPEVQVSKELLMKYMSDIRHYLGFHSYGSYVLTPYGYTKKLPPDNERLLKVGHAMREAILKLNGRNYTVGSPAHIFYAAGGASDDFSKLYGIPTSMTIELPEIDGGGFLLPKDKIIEIGEEAWASLEPAASHVVDHEDEDVKDSVYVPRKKKSFKRKS